MVIGMMMLGSVPVIGMMLCHFLFVQITVSLSYYQLKNRWHCVVVIELFSDTQYQKSKTEDKPGPESENLGRGSRVMFRDECSVYNPNLSRMLVSKDVSGFVYLPLI